MVLNMKRNILAILTLMAAGLMLQACGAAPSPEQSCNFVQNGQAQRVSWGSQVPVVLYIDSSVSGEFFDAIKDAATEWNRAIGREVLKIGGWTNGQSRPSQDGANIIYHLDAWEDERANEQARTTVYWAGDRIYEADIRINGKNFEFFAGAVPVPGHVDMQSLMVHEFGHVLGLSHTDTPVSVMARSLPSATFRRGITTVDLKSVRCEY